MSMEGRLQQHIQPLTLDRSRVEEISKCLEDNLNEQIESYTTANSPSLQLNPPKPVIGAIPVSDTLITDLPTGSETGTSFVLELGATAIRGARVAYGGNRSIGLAVVSKSMLEVLPDCEHPLRSPKTTCSQYVLQVCNVVRDLLREHQLDQSPEPVELVLCVEATIVQHSQNSAILVTWVHGVETARECPDDPIEGTDLCRLLNSCFQRHKIPAVIAAATSSGAALLMAGAYEKPRSAPRCIVGVNAGAGIRTVHVELNAASKGFIGSVINCECGYFLGETWGPPHKYELSRCLPACLVDGEAEVAVSGSLISGQMPMSNMVAFAFISEVCRLLALKVLQNEAPKHAWTPGSLPFAACKKIIQCGKDSDELPEMLSHVWRSSVSEEAAEAVRKIVIAVFGRAAVLTAITISAVAKRTGRLQPALGGASVALDGELMEDEVFLQLVRRNLDMIYETDTERLLNFITVQDGGLKGAGLILIK